MTGERALIELGGFMVGLVVLAFGYGIVYLTGATLERLFDAPPIENIWAFVAFGLAWTSSTNFLLKCFDKK